MNERPLREILKETKPLMGDHTLTAEDKQRLKAHYLNHLITQRAKKLLQHFPEDFPADQRFGQNPKTRAPPRRSAHSQAAPRSPFSCPQHLPTAVNSSLLTPSADANKFSTHTSDGAILLKLIS